MNRAIKLCAFALALLLLTGWAVAEAPQPVSVALDRTGTVRLPLGDTLTLTPVLTPADAETTFTWRTSKKSVATVSGGVVTAKKAGTATVTVTTANRKRASVRIRVYDPYLPTGVRLDRTGTVKLPLGETLTLIATLSPDTARSTLKWASTKRKVASVSGGVVTAKKEGTATVTVTTRNNKKARVKIRVYDPYKPESVSLDKSGTQTILVGSGLQLTAALKPATAQSALKWKSSNRRVAVVNQDGFVGALAPGTATVTVTTRNKKTAKVRVKVIDDGNQPIVMPDGYDLPYVIYACKNSHTIAIIARDDNGDWTRVLRRFPTGTGRNNSTDVGYYTIVKKERWHKWGSGYSPFANKLSVGIYLHGPIYKSKNQYAIRPNYYNCIGTDCSSGCLRTVCGCAAWVYYNCPVGTAVIVAQNGRFTAPRPAKIGKKATKDPTDPGDNPEILITGFSVDPGALTLEPGATRTLTPVEISPSNASTRRFTYLCGDVSVATVSDGGVVTAVGPGETTVTVTAADDFKCTVKVPVTVAAAAPEGAPPVAAEAETAPEETAPVLEKAADAPEEVPVPEEAADAPEEDPVPEAQDISQPGEDDGLSAEPEAAPGEAGEIIIDDA
ncbi:MAG: Ig-like domain-containing protein [Clostridia bacterium]|nr:Ig-like domain-containing protein [Clostridia bacterium]